MTVYFTLGMTNKRKMMVKTGFTKYGNKPEIKQWK